MIRTWGQRIREAREQFDMTTAEVAAELGVHRRTIQNYEAGNWEPRYSVRVRIGDYYGIGCDRCEGVHDGN